VSQGLRVGLWSFLAGWKAFRPSALGKREFNVGREKRLKLLLP
jgi:hypothetical protein